MRPPSMMLDVWSDTFSRDDVMVDILLPTGFMMCMSFKREATLLEIKEEALEAAQHRPLCHRLLESNAYAFQCVNASTALREELLDEERRLCDARPFQAVLRLVERRGDLAERMLDERIRVAIGKCPRELEDQKSSEVHDFRKQMRSFCEQVTAQLESQTWEQQLLSKRPVALEQRPELPEYLRAKLTCDNIVLSVTMEQDRSESTFKFCVKPETNAKALFEVVLRKKGPSIGLQKGGLDNYLLKICGLEEYLVGPYPLSQYKYIQECLSNDKIPELALVSDAKVRMELKAESGAAQSQSQLDCQRSRSFQGQSTLPKRKKQVTVSTWTIAKPFVICVRCIRRLNCDSKAKIGLECGLFHGEEPLCAVAYTSVKPVTDDSCVWEEAVQFEIEVKDLPRMARLCFCLYEFSPTAKNTRFRKCQDGYANPIAWVNMAVFDYKGVLKTAPSVLSTWPYPQDTDDYDTMLRPLGWVATNQNKDQAAALNVSFETYQPQCSLVVYPSLDKILSYADEDVKENGDSTACNNMPHASKSHLEQLRQICEKDSLYQLHEQEKELMWFLRKDCCSQLPNALPKLLRCVKWHDRREVAQMTSLLCIWPRLAPDKSLELLDYVYPDQTVRSFAVTCLKDISNEELSLYLLQLVQALKHESYLQSDLLKFLLQRALLHRHIGHKLFWLLRSELWFPEVSVRFGLVLEAYCRGATSHIEALAKQVEALHKLKIVNELVQSDANRRKEAREKLKYHIQQLLAGKSYSSAFSGLHNPLDPRYKFGKLIVEKCKFLDSKMKPLWLAFENNDSYGKDIFIIFKHGDDLRQDMLTLQMIRIMDKLWKDEGLDFRMIPYQCLATDHRSGLIEVVLDANTIANIQKEKGFTATSAFKKGSLLAWLRDHNPDEKSLSKAADEFTLSCAGYCVATYVLGVADRHSDNIMVKTNGQLFHVDYGHILGKFKEKFGFKRERVPFVLTHDFVYIITRGHTQKSQEFVKFQQHCERAFVILRRKGSFILSLFAMMLSTGIPELSSERDLDYLRDTLVLDMTEQEALKHFRSKFDEALKNSWKTSVNWMAHNWAKDNKMAD